MDYTVACMGKNTAEARLRRRGAKKDGEDLNAKL